jgi:hypothetical protein
MKNDLYRMRMILTVLLCIVSATLFAQHVESIRVPAGTNFRDVVSKHIYLYPEFIRGKVYFKNGDTPEPTLNLNLLTGDMQYIGLNNDTLSMANPLELDYLTIGSDTFYFNEGYLKIIAGGPSARLATMQRIKFADNQPIGAYGLPSSAATIKPYQTYAHTGQIHRLALNEDLLLSKEIVYYFGNRNKEFRIASKKNVLRLLPRHEDPIEKYFRQNNVSFHNREELVKLATFLQGL